ncbi:MAG: CHAT domain-containing protein [Saprospiraceae bacterium]
MDVDKLRHYTYLAIPLLKKTHQWEKYIYCLAGLSLYYRVKEDFDSLEINNRLAFTEAKKYLEPGNYVYNATVSNLGLVYSNVRQDYKKAIMHYKEALALFIKDDLQAGVRGSVLKNIGDIYLQQGDFQNALSYFQSALSAYRKTLSTITYEKPNISFKVAEIYQGLARVYQYQKNYPQAKAYLLRMLEMMDNNAKAFESSYYVYCYNNLAEVALQQSDLIAAQAYLDKALHLPTLSNQQKAEIDHLLSRINLRQAVWGKAKELALRAYGRMPKTKHVSLAEIRSTQADIEQASGHYKRALDFYDQATTLLLPNTTFQLGNPISSEINILSPIDFIEILEAKAETFERLYQQEQRSGWRDSILACYTSIAYLSDRLRQDYQSEASKIFLTQNTYAFYENGMRTAALQYNSTRDPKYLDELFFFSEKSKAALLLDEIKAKEAAGIYTIDPALLEQDYQLRVDINYYKKLIDIEEKKGDKKEEKKWTDWNGVLLKLAQQREQIQEEIKAQYPNYAAFTHDQIPELEKVRQQILATPGSAMVSYFMGRKNSYALFISRDAVEIKNITNEEHLQQQIGQLRLLMKMDRPDALVQFAFQSHVLYRELLDGFPLDPISKLIIVPDGPLCNLPFETLLRTKNKASSPREWPFLIKTTSISYAYSATVLLSQLRPPTFSSGAILTIAPIFKNQPQKYLAFSETPINAFRKVKHQSLYEQEASVSGFLDHVHNFGLLYFSTHATAGDSLLNQPAIEFSDQSLYLSDLYTLNIPAQLAVLSACETGIGDRRKGEGVMSLARGFTYAGVPSVATTFWKVNEQTTYTIVDRFFFHLSQGLNKDEALQQAKIDYLHTCDDIRIAPYYWAGMIVIGNTDPFLFEENSFHPKLLLALFIFGLSASYLVRLKRSKKQ